MTIKSMNRLTESKLMLCGSSFQQLVRNSSCWAWGCSVHIYGTVTYC